MNTVVTVLLISSLLGASSSSSIPISTTSQPQITTSSDSVNDGFTKSLSLNCSFLHPHNDEFSVIYSLILSKTQTTEDTLYDEIARVTSISPQTVDVQNSVGAEVKGELSLSNMSYIGYSWKYPSSEVAGKYLCRVHGMDRLGHPVTMAAEARIEEKAVDLEMILDQMRQMQLTQDMLISRLNDTQTHLDHTASQLIKVQTDLDKTKLEQNQTKHELDMATAELENVKTQQNHSLLQQKALLELLSLSNGGNTTKSIMAEHISKRYLGHEYVLSKLSHNKVSIDVMEAECELVGGYLAEITDQSEWDFVESFLTNLTYSGYSVNIGAHDRGHEATWNYIHSGQPVSFFKWKSGEPNNSGGQENCIVLVKSGGTMQMNDLHCLHADDRFLCEIPV